MTDDEMWPTLVRHSRGELTPVESATLHAWAEGDAEREHLLRGVARIGEASQLLGAATRVDEGWLRLRPRLAESEERGRPVLRLRLSREEPRSRWRVALARVAAVGAAAAVLAGAVFGGRGLLERQRAHAAPVFRETAAPRGERAMLQFLDGTRVVLAPASRIRYAVDRGARERIVQLEGEAYFTVARDTARPFVVYAAHGAAQAVGTAFSMRAYPGDSAVRVLVAEGRVALREASAEMGSGTMLEPGQRGTLDTAGLARVELDVDVRAELGWTDGRLSYELTPLGDLVADLERWYDIEIELPDTAWRSMGVTLTIEPGSVDLALRRLATVLGVRYVREGSRARLVR